MYSEFFFSSLESAIGFEISSQEQYTGFLVLEAVTTTLGPALSA